MSNFPYEGSLIAICLGHSQVFTSLLCGMIQPSKWLSFSKSNTFSCMSNEKKHTTDNWYNPHCPSNMYTLVIFFYLFFFCVWTRQKTNHTLTVTPTEVSSCCGCTVIIVSVGTCPLGLWHWGQQFGCAGITCIHRNLEMDEAGMCRNADDSSPWP